MHSIADSEQLLAVSKRTDRIVYMAIVSFKDLIAWQKAQSVVIEIYKDFHEIKDYGFRNQIQRAAMSVANNIAEGHARRSNKAFKKIFFL